MLQVAGRDVAKAQTQTSRLNRYSHIMHDLAVQQAVLKRLNDYDQVIWDKHINIPEQFENPDALLHSPKNYWVALDYERPGKEDKRIYLAFMNHARALIKRHYSGVYYLFDRNTTSCTTRPSSRPRHGPNTSTIARPAKSRRPAPISSLMPLSTYAIVFSSFTSLTPAQWILLKKGGWGDERQSYTRKTGLSAGLVWWRAATGARRARRVMPTLSRSTGACGRSA